MSDQNLNLNKNLLGGGQGGKGWGVNIWKVHTYKGSSSQMRTIAYKGGRRGSNFDAFCMYLLCRFESVSKSVNERNPIIMLGNDSSFFKLIINDALSKVFHKGFETT